MIDRIAATLGLLGAMVVPTDVVSFFQLREVQFIAAVLVVIITILYDYLSGLILGLALVVIYYRLHMRYMKEYGSVTGLPKHKVEDVALDNEDVRKGGPMVSLFKDYITPANLSNAQNNVFSDDNSTKELLGIKGVFGEDVYGAQGMYPGMPGLDKKDIGTLIQ
jgi:hypothetical protein